MSTSQYTLLEAVYSSEHSVVHRGQRAADQQPVIIKRLPSDHPALEEVVRLKYEFAIQRDLSGPGVVRAFALEPVFGALSIIMEDAGRTSLMELIESGPVSLPVGLRIATSIAEALANIHRQSVVHMDIKPHNIIVNLDPLQVKITDFGAAMRLTKDARGPEVVAGTFAYMSPEQTGRMNRLIDARTDLYSLGVTLYELLTGALPFEATDTSELFHCHIARRPTPPREVSGAIPGPVSDIVMKLLAKMPEDRYQTASGLRADLAECLRQLSSAGSVEPFPLARLDRPEKLRIPQKLYGRDVDLSTLAAAWERTTQGALSLLLVSGFAGIGKTAFVNELQKTIIGRRGHFVVGKFDQRSRSAPYAAIAQAFRGLVQQLLTERDEVLSAWRERIQGAVGANGQLIIDLIPEVELIIGAQPSVQDLGPGESQARFGIAFQDFARSLATEAHPVVIFLDDLQWADPASLAILKLLLTNPMSGHLMVIGSFRDNEMDAGHVLWRIKDELEEAGTPVDEIKLGPLDLASVTLLVADTLGASADHARPLAQLVYERTRGNPFFLGQFLEVIYQEGLVFLDESRGAWAWDVRRIRDAMVTDSVADLLATKLHGLSEDARRVLGCAACVGHAFEFKALLCASDAPPKPVAAAMQEALREGLIVPLSAEYRFLQGDVEAGDVDATPFTIVYRFLHDRVQQVADAGLDEGAKREVHLRLARALRDEAAHERRDEALFELIGHVSKAAALVVDPIERKGFARLALTAGKRAKVATAYQAAASYLELGCGFLPESGWEEEHDLAFALHFERAECEYLAGRIEQAEARLKALEPQSALKHEIARIQMLRVVIAMTQGRGPDAMVAGMAGLKLFGIELPDVGDIGKQQAAFGAELGAIAVNLAGRRVEDLVDATPMSDPDMRLATQILTELMGAASHVSPFLLATTIATQVNLSLKYGPSEDSCQGYNAYGFLLAAVMGQPKEGYAFGRLALALCEKFQSVRLACKIYQLFASFAHFMIPLRDTLVSSEKAYAAGMGSGDALYLSYTCGQIFMHRLGAGDELPLLRKEADRLLVVAKRVGSQVIADFLKIGRQYVLTLERESHDPCGLFEDAASEEELKQHLRGANTMYQAAWYYTRKLELFYRYRRYPDALAMAEEAEKLVATFVGFYFTTDLVFYKCMTMAALYPSASPEDQERYLAALTAEVGKLASWADTCPANYRHKHLLVLAEQARISAKDAMAIELYGRAIAAARDSGATPIEGLANELCARFYMERGKPQMARGYISEAYSAYLVWGAAAKLADLRASYPDVLQAPSDAPPGARPALMTARRKRGSTSKLTGRKPTELMSLELLDIAAVMRTAQTIAGEVDLERVLDRFMRIVIENAGAQAGSLILEREQGLVVEVQVSASSNTISVGLDSPLESRSDLPISVVKYVARTSEGVVLSDAASDARFMNDPYIWVHRPRSVLCLPMAHQGRLIGVLYLENNATNDAFPAARLELLKLLASLSAIAVENARLYSYVQRRTEELHDMEVQLQRELRERERAEADRAALQEEIIQVQSARLAEMSTPIIPITDRIMVMPLIGTMDRQRAQQVLTTALQGVQSHRAEVVIIDITGVKLVDTDVASTLIGTAGALRMLGAQAVITGIRPDVAQALISLDVDFGAMVTLGSLQNGIAYALGRTGEARTLALGRRSR